MLFVLNVGKEIFKAVAIAALSAVFTKSVDYCFDVLKERRGEKKEKEGKAE